jgi:RNA polymerase sigma-70 factor (sigma-E family)
MTTLVTPVECPVTTPPDHPPGARPDPPPRPAGGPDRDDRLRDFVRVAWPRLLRTAWLLCGDRHEAEDLVQTALVKVVRAWPRIERKDDPFVYARAVLANTAASRWRRRRRYDELTAGRRDPAPAPDPATEVVLRDAVWRALDTLPPRTRAVLVLRYFEDLTEAQTAGTLGCSVGAVKSQASRGLSRLRARLDAADLTAVPATGPPMVTDVVPHRTALPRRTS